MKMQAVTTWLSILISLSLMLVLLSQWEKAESANPNFYQVENQTDVEREIEKYTDNMKISQLDSVNTIPTGMYIQTLSFINSSDTYLTGYIWQRYPKDLPGSFSAYNKFSATFEDTAETLSCKKPPFLFPDSVYHGQYRPYYLANDTYINGHRLCGWYFEIALRQHFNFSKYPFDNAVINLTLRFSNIQKDIIMSPDFDAYFKKTGKKDIFGINEDIVLSAWQRKNTFFKYNSLHNFNTNFSYYDQHVLNNHPELSFNIFIKRNLLDSLVEHMLSVVVVLVLLFSMLLISNHDAKDKVKHGFNTASLLSGCSALFFVVLVAHIQLRSLFSGSSLVYLEGYYYLAYLLLIATTINGYLIAEKPNSWTKIIHYRENLIAKLLFWPLSLSFSVIWTQLRLFSS
jgi:hypothetical protein